MDPRIINFGVDTWKTPLFFNELWKHVCSGDKFPIKPIDARELTKWENKDEQTLTPLRSFVMMTCIYTLKIQMSACQLFKNMFDTRLE